MNILYLHAHDLGRELGCHGAPAHTPHLDALAARGTRFDRALCAAPTCSPSRAALLTGQWAHETGMLGLAHRGFALAHPERHLAHVLRERGWLTALCGIQHEFAHDAPLPYERVAGIVNDPLRCDEVAADAAAAFLAGAPREPFFLSCGFRWPHREFPEPDTAAYPPAALPLPLGLPDEPSCRLDYAAFLTGVSRMDAACGRVLAALERSGLAERTLVFFTTDHGPAFPGAKCQMTPDGMGVSLLWVDPERRGPAACPALVSHVDIFPTLCARLGLAAPPWLRGASLLPLLDGRATAARRETFCEVTYHAAYEPQRAVVTGSALLARRYDGRDRPVLPNVDDGPAKSCWLEGGYGDRVPVAERYEAFGPDAESPDDLRGRLERWMTETDDPLLRGHVPPPPGARINDPDGHSPYEPTLPAG